MAEQGAHQTVLELGPIGTLEELSRVEAELRERFAGKDLLFRGQGNLYPRIRSGRARANAKKTAPAVEAGWISLASQMLGQPLDSPYAVGLAKAILQHYGAPTFFVDVTSNINVASWFATHTYAEGSVLWAGSAFRFVDHASYTMRTDGLAYILVLALNGQELQDKGVLFDLSKLPPDITRPHAQHAWLLLDRPPVLPTPNDFWIATIKIDCARFRHQTTMAEVFPPPSKDPAYAALRSLPFVQLPSAYFPPRPDKAPPNSNEVPAGTESADRPPTPEEEAQEKRDRGLCFARRAIAINDYGNPIDPDNYNHKWEDYTLYEPFPMQMWKRWRADLSARFEGVSGNIKDSLKVTISPIALELLQASDAPCDLPNLGAEDLFFTFSALDHDKVVEHGPPYNGVWLHRDDELIVETPMEADEDVLATMGGHAYLLRFGKIERQTIANSCGCGMPETHDARVAAVLRIPALVARREIILVPHPLITDWFVVL